MSKEKPSKGQDKQSTVDDECCTIVGLMAGGGDNKKSKTQEIGSSAVHLPARRPVHMVWSLMNVDLAIGLPPHPRSALNLASSLAGSFLVGLKPS